MKKVLKDFFTFEKRGQKGILVLLLILLLQLLILWGLNFYNPHQKEHPELILIDPKLLDSLEQADSNHAKYKIAEVFNEYVISREAQNTSNERFKFNPNTASEEQWKRLGLTSNQIRVITKYLKKGGHFDFPEELLKIKAVPVSLWKELIPFVELEHKASTITLAQVLKDTINGKKEFNENLREERLAQFRKNLSFEFNTCSRFNLQQLQLIDSVTIDKIMRYKKGLGGFVNLSQLYEIEGVDTSNFNQLKTHLTLDLNTVKTININNCSVSQLSKHPYLSYNVATALVNYRNAHGKYTQLGDLKKCFAMNEQLLKKIAPYLRLSDE